MEALFLIPIEPVRSAAALLASHPHPTDFDGDDAISGNAADDALRYAGTNSRVKANAPAVATV
jgi:hypothetical protein